MNTPLDHEPENLRYAEYVLGVLDAGARAAVEREVASNPGAAAEVARWQRYLLPLIDDIPAIAPPSHVWTRIESTLAMQTKQLESTRPARAGWWSNLALWRGVALGAAAVAVAFIVAFVVPRTSVAPPAAPGTTYMASAITQTDGQVGWTATMDLAHARIVVVPTKPQALPNGRAPELWLIPAGQKPIAVGMITASGPTTIALGAELVARIGPTAALAVSVEPPGGSPTGQPTGPVIAKGAIGAAVQSSGKPVAVTWQATKLLAHHSA